MKALKGKDEELTPAERARARAEIAKLALEKFGGDSLEETRRNFDGYQGQLDNF